MQIISNIIFSILLATGIGFFVKNIKKLIRNIRLGKPIDRSDNPKVRFANMARIALGQTKMVRRPIAGILHVIVYLGFIIINIEVLEICIDGVIGTHRVFAFLGGFYDFLIGSFEILAFLVLVSVFLFWIRRNILHIQRFKTLKGWSKNDGNIILYFEVVLMLLFLTMNAADFQLQTLGAAGYPQAGSFPISQFLTPIFEGFTVGTLTLVERTAWWLHIIGILIFLNYLYYSKHLHILLAFPNTYYADLEPQGRMDNIAAVTKEVQLMLDPNADPFAATPEQEEATPEKFGASDVSDLNWVQLLGAYTCTECGRCTSECPANQTGKKLSPRKIMMDTRDRLEEVGNQIDQKEKTATDAKQLLNDYITPEELWACTSCNACVEACPVSISPLSIILDMRRYLVMEQSAASSDLNTMMTNIENNGAPWPFNQMDRLQWNKE